MRRDCAGYGWDMSEPRGQLPVASTREVVRALGAHLRGRRVRLAWVLLLFLLEAATALVFPFAIGSAVDALIADAGREDVLVACALMAVAALLAGVLTWAGGSALARLAETVIAELREEFVVSALHLPRSAMEEAGPGDIIARASDDIATISETVPSVLPRFCVSLFTIALVAGGIGAIDPRYLMAFLVTLPVYALTVRSYLRAAPGAYAKARAVESERAQHILETLTQRPTVAAFRLSGRQLGRVRASAWQAVRWAMRTRILQNRLFGGLSAAEGIGLLAVLLIGVWLAAQGAATAGSVTSATLLYLRIVAPVDAVLFLMDDLQQSFAALGRVLGIRRIRADDLRAIQRSQTGEIVFDSVHFCFGGAPVLTDVSLRIAPGEVVAVVGSTGSGKSTLAALLAGVYAPCVGSIERGVPEERIATVTQESHVFAGTLRENFLLADALERDSGGRDGEILAVLARLGAADLLTGLPAGLETEVGHGGVQLSPAQEQLVALVRVMLIDPDCVILDEATAEAGTADGGRLEQVAAEVVRGRSALVIAHRLTQAERADRVIVLESGRIVEEGAHAELLILGGRYAELWAAGMRGRKS